MSNLDQAVETFRRWLHMPDAGALYAMLAAVAANRLDGDPVWLLLVGPPGGGKSEMLGALSGLEDVHPAATLTEAALLSGTPKKDHGAQAKGGLLRSIGGFGIIVAKDFGSVLSMNRDARALLLAALREIYDGSWTRHVGTDGGRTLSWTGKVGFVGGCTPTIDRHHAVMGAMGERFLLYRLPPTDPTTQAKRALAHAGREKAMRSELAAAIATILDNLDDETAPKPNDQDDDRLIALATFVARARSAVERDGYTREIELIPEPEAPTRLVVVLRRLMQGFDAIGLDRETAWTVTIKAALDSVPTLRLAVMQTLYADGGALDTTLIADTVGYPTVTTRRALEELAVHGLVDCHRQGEGHAHRWTLSTFAAERLGGFPEKSSSLRSGGDKEPEPEPLLIPSDVSERVSEALA
jgi:hypothetical protein